MLWGRAIKRKNSVRKHWQEKRLHRYVLDIPVKRITLRSSIFDIQLNCMATVFVIADRGTGSIWDGRIHAGAFDDDDLGDVIAHIYSLEDRSVGREIDDVGGGTDDRCGGCYPGGCGGGDVVGAVARAVVGGGGLVGGPVGTELDARGVGRLLWCS